MSSLLFRFLTGFGIANNSGVKQAFLPVSKHIFLRKRSADDATFTLNSPSALAFGTTSSAGSATINVTETLALVTFGAKASADDPTVTSTRAVSTSMTARPRAMRP